MSQYSRRCHSKAMFMSLSSTEHYGKTTRVSCDSTRLPTSLCGKWNSLGQNQDTGEPLREKPKSIRKAAGQSLRRTISWIRSYISVAAIYYLIAEYGESYRRAFYWSLASVLVFYPTLRFLRDGTPNSLPAFSAEYLHSVESGLRLFFQVFALPNLDAVDIAFRLWSALLLAIFFIAVRRKFERKS